MSFEPREGDLCIWVKEAKFFELDEEMEEEDYTMAQLMSGYEVLAAVFRKASIPFAAIGGFAMAVLGGREGTLTHDVDFQFKGKVVDLFNVLRVTKGIRLKEGLQADNYRVHCQIAADKWVGTDLLITNNPVSDHTFTRDGVVMLDITPLLESKLKSFSAREAQRDSNDIVFLVEKYAASIKKGQLTKNYVDFYLENAHLSAEVLARMKQVL